MLYSIRVIDRGPNAAAGLIVTDRLPAGMVLAGRPRNATVKGRTITWRIPNLPAGRSVILTLPVCVTGRRGVRLTDTATARASNASRFAPGHAPSSSASSHRGRPGRYLGWQSSGGWDERTEPL